MRINKKLLEQISNIRRDAHDIAIMEDITFSLFVWINKGKEPIIQEDPFYNERLNTSFRFLFDSIKNLLDGRIK